MEQPMEMEGEKPIGLEFFEKHPEMLAPTCTYIFSKRGTEEWPDEKIVSHLNLLFVWAKQLKMEQIPDSLYSLPCLRKASTETIMKLIRCINYREQNNLKTMFDPFQMDMLKQFEQEYYKK